MPSPFILFDPVGGAETNPQDRPWVVVQDLGIDGGYASIRHAEVPLDLGLGLIARPLDEATVDMHTLRLKHGVNRRRADSCPSCIGQDWPHLQSRQLVEREKLSRAHGERRVGM